MSMAHTPDEQTSGRAARRHRSGYAKATPMQTPMTATDLVSARTARKRLSASLPACNRLSIHTSRAIKAVTTASGATLAPRYQR